MSLWNAFQRWNPNTRPLFRQRATLKGVFSQIILWFLLGTLLVSPAFAQAPMLESDISHVFGESLRFELHATLDSPVVEVILFYGQKGEGLVRRIYPDFQPGARLDVVHIEELEGGQFAPGTPLIVWWELQTATGQVVKTEQQEYIYTDEDVDWKVLRGARVDYYWYGNDERRAQKLLNTAESVIDRLAQDVGVVVDRRISVYAYNNARDMSRAISSRSQTYDDRVLTLGVAVGEETLLLLASHRDAEMIATHELSHIVVGIATDNPYSDLPRWLDEGLAMYAEGELAPDNRQALERAIAADKLLSIRSMSSYSGQASEVDLFYGEAYSVVSFMLETYGRDKMRELLAVFAKGARQEDALRQVYGLGLDELDNAWRASLGLGPRKLPEATPVPWGAKGDIGVARGLGGEAQTVEPQEGSLNRRPGVCLGSAVVALPFCLSPRLRGKRPSLKRMVGVWLGHLWPARRV
ncbi:MAG: hypothetical protein H5T69_01560 [Chloroflexi bacterium]|nr:hypothetical protein [Chloroflexota bacterium]